MKRAFLSFLWRMPRAHLTELAHEFAETVVPPLLYPEIMAEVEKHRAAGRAMILNTASPEFYATEIARVLRFDHVFGSRVVFPSDPLPLIPRIEGENNKHAEKLKRMKHLMESALTLPLPGSYAYSDSKADLPMLRYVEHPVVVHPDTTRKVVDGEIVGNYAGWGARFLLDGQARLLYSVGDVATDPTVRRLGGRRGIYREMAAAFYDRVGREGVPFCFGHGRRRRRADRHLRRVGHPRTRCSPSAEDGGRGATCQG